MIFLILIKNIFHIAQRAPSNANIQPWYVYVASGEAKRRIQKQLVSKVKKNIPTNITTIKHFKATEDDNFLSYGSSSKNLYLLLLEDL